MAVRVCSVLLLSVLLLAAAVSQGKAAPVDPPDEDSAKKSEKSQVQEVESQADGKQKNQEYVPPVEGKPQDQAPPEAGKPQDQAPPEAGKPQDQAPPEAGKPQDQAPPEAGQPQDQAPPEAGQPQDQAPPEAGNTQEEENEEIQPEGDDGRDDDEDNDVFDINLDSDVNKEIPDQQEKSPSGNKENSVFQEESESSHFFAYLVTSAILVAVLYIAYHNKRKIIAFAIEGRRSKGGRRPNSGEYQRLDHKI